MERRSNPLLNTIRKQGLSLLFSALFTVVLFFLLWILSDKINSDTATGMAQKIACCGGLSLLVGTLLFILSGEMGRSSDEPVAERPNWFFPVVSGVLSLCAMCVAYTFVGMWPFGEKTGMVVDMHHQYAPLLAGLRDNLLSFDLSVYSFEVGLGANYISLFGYYLGSPLNLLLVLFPERLLAEGILLITLIKNALSGALFALCVQTVYRRKGLFIPLVSVMYSLMMYLLAYSWNIMWLDVVMVLPLVVLGFERLMHTGKYLTYVLSLAFCLYVNYYIGFMLCIFLVLYYVAYVLRSRQEGKALAVSFGRFAGFSVLGAGLAAFMLIPVYLALQQTSAAGSDLPDINNTIDFFDLIGRHLAGTSPTIRSGNLPNMYCGVLTAVCIPLFALNKGISRRRRAAYMGVWLLLAVSFLINWTDLAWHGLHSPNDLPYRFSFVYSFFVLLMAYEALLHLKDITVKQVFGVLAGAVAYLIIEEHFGSEDYGFEQIYINLALIAVYAVILAVAANRMMRERVTYALLLLVVTAEMVLNGGSALVKVNKSEYFTMHQNYVDNTITDLLYDTVERAQEIGDDTTDDGFYRMEFLPRRTCVDTALFHYRGITTFSSSNYYTTTKLMGGLGYAINGVNSHLYKSFVPFTDSLLGIRYVALQAKVENHAQLKLLESLSLEDQTYYLYENTSALGLGFMASSAVKNYSYTQYNPITSQNELFTALTGIQQELYTVHPITSTDAGSASFGSSRFQATANGSNTFTATVSEGGQMFIYVDCNAADSLSVSSGSNSWSVTPHEPFIIDGGTVTAGTEVTLRVTSDISCSGNFYVATMNSDVYSEGMTRLSASQLNVTDFSNTRIRGTVNASTGGTMMTSIPYDEGWTVKVDGNKVETLAVSEGFLAFDIGSGTHEVTLTYTPAGFGIGVTLSFLSLAVLAMMLLAKKYGFTLSALKAARQTKK